MVSNGLAALANLAALVAAVVVVATVQESGRVVAAALMAATTALVVVLVDQIMTAQPQALAATVAAAPMASSL
jgi:hypothetical protein